MEVFSRLYYGAQGAAAGSASKISPHFTDRAQFRTRWTQSYSRLAFELVELDDREREALAAVEAIEAGLADRGTADDVSDDAFADAGDTDGSADDAADAPRRAARASRARLQALAADVAKLRLSRDMTKVRALARDVAAIRAARAKARRALEAQFGADVLPGSSASTSGASPSGAALSGAPPSVAASAFVRRCFCDSETPVGDAPIREGGGVPERVVFERRGASESAFVFQRGAPPLDEASDAALDAAQLRKDFAREAFTIAGHRFEPKPTTERAQQDDHFDAVRDAIRRACAATLDCDESAFEEIVDAAMCALWRTKVGGEAWDLALRLRLGFGEAPDLDAAVPDAAVPDADAVPDAWTYAAQWLMPNPSDESASLTLDDGPSRTFDDDGLFDDGSAAAVSQDGPDVAVALPRDSALPPAFSPAVFSAEASDGGGGDFDDDGDDAWPDAMAFALVSRPTHVASTIAVFPDRIVATAHVHLSKVRCDDDADDGPDEVAFVAVSTRTTLKVPPRPGPRGRAAHERRAATASPKASARPDAPASPASPASGAFATTTRVLCLVVVACGTQPADLLERRRPPADGYFASGYFS